MPNALSVYFNRRILVILLMGYASGLPLALSGATLSYWLAKTGVSKTEIGLFALVALSYNLKFLWAPLFDHVAPPVLASLGRRRGWMLATQVLLAGAILFTGTTDPSVEPLKTALGAVLIAFFSASQDVVIDAYRVELLRSEEQGAGAAATQYGYRLGMLVAGAGAIALSAVTSWFWVYAAMAAALLIGTLVTLFSPEPELIRPRTPRHGLAGQLRYALVDPFADFARRPGWAVLLLFVVLFKLGDALAGGMANPFYVEMGFTAGEIAAISKVFGLIATLTGVFAGGALVGRLGTERALLVTGILQLASNWMFAWQATVGHDTAALAATIFVENFCGGAGSAAFVAFLAGLCAREFTATQNALLTSLAAVGRTLFASFGGWLADRLDWVTFFLATSAAALPGLLLLGWLMMRGSALDADRQELPQRL